jgi:hypothetical protein
MLENVLSIGIWKLYLYGGMYDQTKEFTPELMIKGMPEGAANRHRVCVGPALLIYKSHSARVLGIFLFQNKFFEIVSPLSFAH